MSKLTLIVLKCSSAHLIFCFSEGLNFAIKISELKKFIENVNRGDLKTSVKKLENEINIDSEDKINFEDPVCESLGCKKGTSFVGSINSDIYHNCSCSFASRIKRENIVCFENEKLAISYGYRASKKC